MKRLSFSMFMFILLINFAYCQKSGTDRDKDKVSDTSNFKSEKTPKNSTSLVLKDNDVLATFVINDKSHSITFADYEYVKKNIYKYPLKKDTKEEIERYVNDVIKWAVVRESFSISSSEEKFEDDASLKKMIDNQLRNLMIEKLYNIVSSQATKPTDDKIENYYQMNKNQYKVDEKYQIQYVYSYCDEPENKEKWEMAKRRAEEALEKIKNGQDFSEIAKTYSNSPTSQDGKIVSFIPNTINPIIEQVAKGLKKGEVSNIFSTKRGFMIVKLIDYTKEGFQPLNEKLKKEIQDLLYNQAKSRCWDDFLNEYTKKINPKKNFDVLNNEKINDDAILFEFANFKFAYSDLKNKFTQDSRIKEMIESKKDIDKVLNEILNDELLFYAAKERGLDKDEEVLQKLNLFKKDIIFRKKFSELINKDIVVTEKELRDYYEKNKELFKSKKETKIKVIKIEIEDSGQKSPTDSKKAMAKAFWSAQEAYNRIKRGEDFDNVMKEYCGKDWDGAFDYQPMGPRGRIIDMTADKLKVGEVSEPVQYKRGYYIIKMLEIKEPQQLSFDESKEMVENYLRYEKMMKKEGESIENLSSQYKLQMKLDNISKIVESI